jgi:rhodanese-related sulfurtransferase
MRRAEGRRGANVPIIDSRSEFEYKEGYIPKTIYIPQERFYMIQSFLPKE